MESDLGPAAVRSARFRLEVLIALTANRVAPEMLAKMHEILARLRAFGDDEPTSDALLVALDAQALVELVSLELAVDVERLGTVPTK